LAIFLAHFQPRGILAIWSFQRQIPTAEKRLAGLFASAKCSFARFAPVRARTRGCGKNCGGKSDNSWFQSHCVRTPFRPEDSPQKIPTNQGDRPARICAVSSFCADRQCVKRDRQKTPFVSCEYLDVKREGKCEGTPETPMAKWTRRELLKAGLAASAGIDG